LDATSQERPILTLRLCREFSHGREISSTLVAADTGGSVYLAPRQQQRVEGFPTGISAQPDSQWLTSIPSAPDLVGNKIIGPTTGGSILQRSL
jgi:hypothetical protein